MSIECGFSCPPLFSSQLGVGTRVCGHQLPRWLLFLSHLFPFTLWDLFWPALPSKAPQFSHWMLGFSNLCQCLQYGLPSSNPFPDSRQLSLCVFFPCMAQTPTCAQSFHCQYRTLPHHPGRNRGQCIHSWAYLAPSHGICTAVGEQRSFLLCRASLPCALNLILSCMGPSFVHDSSFFSVASSSLSSFPHLKNKCYLQCHQSDSPFPALHTSWMSLYSLSPFSCAVHSSMLAVCLASFHNTWLNCSPGGHQWSVNCQIQ